MEHDYGRFEKDGEWTTMVVIERHPKGFWAFSSAPGWPTFTSVVPGPLLPCEEIRSGALFGGAERIEKLVTFTAAEETGRPGGSGCHVDLPRWTLESADEGDPWECPIGEWVEVNADLDPEDLYAVANLRPGERYSGGGGAWAEWTVRRGLGLQGAT